MSDKTTQRAEFLQATAKLEKITTKAILKVLVRLKKTYEAVERVSKVIMLVQRREQLVGSFMEQEVLADGHRVRALYTIILKLSQKIHLLIARLRVDHPLLNRPFVYGRVDLTSHVVTE